MRILHILPSINAVTGGPSKSIPLQLRALARLGHHVELFTTRWPHIGGANSVREHDGVIEHIFPAMTVWPLTHVPYSRDLIDAVRAATGRFDIYQISSLWNPLVSHVMTIFRRSRLPYAIIAHGMLDPVVFARHRIGKWL